MNSDKSNLADGLSEQGEIEKSDLRTPDESAAMSNSVCALSEQSEAGVMMMVMMLVMDFTIVPYWSYNYFGKSTQSDLRNKRANLNSGFDRT